MIYLVGLFDHFNVASALVDKRISKLFENPDDICAANNWKMWQRDAPGV